MKDGVNQMRLIHFLRHKAIKLFQADSKSDCDQQVRLKSYEIMTEQMKLLHDASKETKNQRVIYINTACMLDIMKTLYNNDSSYPSSFHWADTRKSFLGLLDENVPQDT